MVIHKESQTIFGVDWGEKYWCCSWRFKVKNCSPLCVISSNNKETLQDKLLVLLNEWTPVKVVYGLPYHENGSKHKLMPVIKKFASSIFKKYNSEYFFINELLSSNLASDFNA